MGQHYSLYYFMRTCEVVSCTLKGVGAQYSRLRDFKRDLKSTLEDFIARRWIRSFEFQPGSCGVELIKIDLIPSPSQQRSIEDKRANAS